MKYSLNVLVVTMILMVTNVLAQTSPEKPVTITHYGGPDFMVSDGTTSIYIDPLIPNAPNFQRHFQWFRTENEQRPDLVLITHPHRDHCNPDGIRALLEMNPALPVIAPIDTRDALEPVVPAEQLITPLPMPGTPVVIKSGPVTVHVYRTTHDWYTDDASPYSLVEPYHYSYVIVLNGQRIYVSGDSYDYEEIAGDLGHVDAALCHVYKQSDVYQFQTIQRLLSPAYIIPYHLNIKYGMSQPGMAALTDQYRFQGVRAAYLTKGNNRLILQPTSRNRQGVEGQLFDLPATDALQDMSQSSDASGLTFNVDLDTLVRGIPPVGTATLSAHVRNVSLIPIQGQVNLTGPEGWTIKLVDSQKFEGLTATHDFICRYRINAPAALIPDANDSFRFTSTLTTSDGQTERRITKSFEFGTGRLNAWHLLGPFDNSDGKGDDTEYPPEQDISMERIYSGINDLPLRWIPHVSQDLQTGFIDMAGAFDMRETLPRFSRWEEQITGYAVSYVQSPAERDILLHAGAPYGLHIFLNGEHIFQMDGYAFNFHSGQFTVPARLQKGDNTFLVKIVRNRLPDWNLSPWIGFCLRITDRQNRPIPYLEYQNFSSN
jgi:L-ascorbate metabolism protein UlaG (beta-lactamase superfamily)